MDESIYDQLIEAKNNLDESGSSENGLNLHMVRLNNEWITVNFLEDDDGKYFHWKDKTYRVVE